MEFLLNKTDKKKLDQLLLTNETNLDVSKMYVYYLYNLARNINKKDIDFYKSKNNYSSTQAFFYRLMNLLEIDLDDEESLNMATSYCLKGIKKLNIEDYKNNPYLKNIKLNTKHLKNIKIEWDEYTPFEGFPYNDIFVDENNYYQEITQIGFFEEKYPFQVITHDSITWMSIVPNEIETMKEDIQKVKGNVLVYGLGLGYFPYMISLKEEVKEITIIEKDKNIISLFKEVILPQFKYRDKIKIICDDALNFEKQSTKKYDYCYCDLYHGGEDGIFIYLDFKKLEKRSDNYLYWLEKSILNVLRRNIITLIYEKINNLQVDYTKAKNNNDKLINSLYRHFKNTKFTSYEEIHNLLKDDSLRELAKKVHYSM